MSHKLGIEVAQTKERLQFFDCSGYRPVGNCISFLRIHRYRWVFYDMAKILQFCKTECTLFAFCFELMFTQFSKHPMQVFCMVCSFFEKTSISSRYTVANTSSFSARTWSMSHKNVAGALTSPNGSTVYSYKPHRDWKAVRCRLLSDTLNWWYAYVR